MRLFRDRPGTGKTGELTMHRGCSHSVRRIAAAWMFCLVLPAAVQAGAGTKEWRFRVFLDDSEIGYHHFRLNGNRQRDATDQQGRA